MQTHNFRFIATTDRTIVKAGTVRGEFQKLVMGPGERHRERNDLVGDSWGITKGVSIGQIIHVTDFQLADLASPSRVEFLQCKEGISEWDRMLPAYRPQEFLLTQATEELLESITGYIDSSDIQTDVVITTGDNTDSSQENELSLFLKMMDGGDISPAAGTRSFSDAPVGSGDPRYWTPEENVSDTWKARGFPTMTGLVKEATREFRAKGLGVPWLACFGNHDCLVQGRACAPDGFDSFLTGTEKPTDVFIATPDPDMLETYVADPMRFTGGRSRRIEADPTRRMLSKREYVSTHLKSSTSPIGHGFTPDNLANGTSYYVWDGIPGVRIVTLDTTNPAGHVDGNLDPVQFNWLREKLEEVSSTFTDENGHQVQHDVTDKIVVLASHHGLSTMTNNFGSPGGKLASDLQHLLHKFPNVVLWVSGHTHINKVTPRPGPNGGFWEVSTSSVAEWPVQARAIGLSIVNGTGLQITLTMIDSQAPVDVVENETVNLASVHREVAANDVGSVGGLHAQGSVSDRNVVLDLSLPQHIIRALLSSTSGR